MAVRVFVSATFSDLRDERLELLEVFRRFRTVNNLDIEVITMEDFGFSNLAPIDKCIEQVARANAYLGLIGHRYGSVPPGGKQSYTEREYRYAHKLGIPIFVLQKDGPLESSQIETDPEKLRMLNNLREHANNNHVVLRFTNRSDLGKAISLYLPEELKKRFPVLEMSNAESVLVPYFQQQERSFLLTMADAEKTKTLDVLAWSAAGFLRDRGFIEQYISSGTRIRILNISRSGRAITLLSEAANKPDIEDELIMASRRTIRFKKYAELHSGSIELREIDWLPSSSLFIANGMLPEATAWVCTYTPDPKTPGSHKWVTELSSTNHRAALEFYVYQFETLWESAKEVA